MALKDFDQSPASFGNKRRWSDGVKTYEWRPEWQKLRLFGLIYTDAVHSIQTKTGKVYPEFCLGYDQDNDKFFPDAKERCPSCANLPQKPSIRHFINVFDLHTWDNQPRNPPADWACVFLANFPPSLIQAIRGLKEFNEGHSILAPAKGALIGVKYNPGAPAASMYQVQLLEKAWEFNEEMRNLTVVQTMPDGRKVIQKGDGVVPGAFEYIRAVSSAEDMQKSLVRHGHIKTEAPAETPIKVISAIKKLEAMDQEDNVVPTPPRAVASPVVDVSVADEGDLDIPFDPRPTKAASSGEKSAPADCPSAFGSYADEETCYVRCDVRKACRLASGAASASL